MNKEVMELNKGDIDSYIEFINEVFGYQTTKDLVSKMLKKSKILVIKDNSKVVASVVVDENYEYIKNQKYYFISYLGVLKEYRRKRYAFKLFETINDWAKKNNINYIELTSGNQRRAAHYFYKSENFKVRDTTVFVKIY